MSLTLAFVMDPIERVNIHTDTTFAFMLAAQARGHRVVYVPPSGLDLASDELFLRGRAVELEAKLGAHVVASSDVRLAAKDCACVFIRTDPPFDDAYLLATWMLSFAERRGTWVMNSPRGLRAANEKLYALEFPALGPRTIVTATQKDIRAFLAAQGGEAILKPVDGHGGFGVFRLRAQDSNVNTIIDLLTKEGRKPVVVQEFLPAVSEGDKRLLLIDGEVRGAVLRVPQPGEHRGNVHVGGKAVPTEITARDRDIAAAMRSRLAEDGLYFVGLDVIGGKLIEVNVTSPTLVQELRRFGGPDLAVEIIAAVEARAG